LRGAIQVFALRDGGLRDPILGAVGALQLEVLQYRLLHEYGAEIALDLAQAVRAITPGQSGALYDADGRLLGGGVIA